jgi:hypothetical protein
MTERQGPQDKLPGQTAAAALARGKVRVIKSWEEQVRHSLPAAAAQRRPALLDSLPAFLDRLIEALRRPAAEPSREVAPASRAHGRERANLAEYTIDQVIREYQHLRECIFAVTSRLTGPGLVPAIGTPGV